MENSVELAERELINNEETSTGANVEDIERVMLYLRNYYWLL